MLLNFTLERQREVGLCVIEFKFVYLVTQDSQSYIVKSCLRKKKSKEKEKKRDKRRMSRLVGAKRKADHR